MTNGAERRGLIWGTVMIGCGMLLLLSTLIPLVSDMEIVDPLGSIRVGTLLVCIGSSLAIWNRRPRLARGLAIAAIICLSLVPLMWRITGW